MKRFRILAAILAVLMLPISLLVACNGGTDNPDGQVEPCQVHKYGKRETVSKRTCTTDGVEQRVCTVCGYVDRQVEPAYGHLLSDYISDNSATCTEDGTMSKRCSRCSYRETAAEPDSALGHNFVVYKASEDGFTETASCLRCGNATNTRLLGLNIDFEGEMDHLSYGALEVFTAGNASAAEYKIEGTNTYLVVSRNTDTVLGSTEFGVVLTPRADILKGTSTAFCPSYVVEFDVKISKTDTKDLILLYGTKLAAKETFLKYNSEAGVIESGVGAVYALKDSDYDTWLRVGVVLNDGTKLYSVYVNNYLVANNIEYKNNDSYYMGTDLDSLKIVTAAANNVASSFGVDNITMYIGKAPKGFAGVENKEFAVYSVANGDKIVYKVPAEGCTHNFTDNVVAPTCVLSGYTMKTCSVCGGQEVTDVVAPLAHDYVEKNDVEASCTVSAYKNYECSVCGARNIEYYGTPLGHDIDRENPDSYTVVAPTCLEDGYTEGKCVRCGIDIVVDKLAALGHELDYDNEESYVVTAATCLEDGYTTGACKRCGTEITVDPVDALGHTCANPTIVAPTCTEAGYDDCICERCQSSYKTNEVPALGHTMVSSIEVVSGVSKIVSRCVRCGGNEITQDVLTEVPDNATMLQLIKSSGGTQLGSAGNKKFYFDGDATGYVRGSNTSIGATADDFVGRYATLTTKTDLADDARDGNKYAEWYYTPGNCTNSDSVHAYFDMGISRTVSGRNIVFEFSVRKTAGEEEVLPFNFQLIDRSLKYSTGNLFSASLAGVRANGEIYYMGEKARPLAYVTEDKWTRFAVVIHTNAGSTTTFDFYIDGELVVKDVLVSTGNPNYLGYDTLDQIRVQVADQSKTAPGRKIDFDEVYCYYGDIPIYVTGVQNTNCTNLIFSDTSANTVYTDEETGTEFSYLSQTALGNMINFNTKSNSQIFVENFGTEDAPEYGIHIKRDADSIPNLPCVAESDLTGHDTHVVVWNMQQFRKAMFETEIKIAEGTGAFNIFGGRKEVSGVTGSVAEAFLSYADGKIYAGDTEVAEVTFGEWIRVAVAVNEATFKYDVYVEGVKVLESVNMTNQAYKTATYSNLGYRIFHATEDAVYDVCYKDTILYGGVDAPVFMVSE